MASSDIRNMDIRAMARRVDGFMHAAETTCMAKLTSSRVRSNARESHGKSQVAKVRGAISLPMRSGQTNVGKLMAVP